MMSIFRVVVVPNVGLLIGMHELGIEKYVVNAHPG